MAPSRSTRIRRLAWRDLGVVLALLDKPAEGIAPLTLPRARSRPTDRDRHGPEPLASLESASPARRTAALAPPTARPRSWTPPRRSPIAGRSPSWCSRIARPGGRRPAAAGSRSSPTTTRARRHRIATSCAYRWPFGRRYARPSEKQGGVRARARSGESCRGVAFGRVQSRPLVTSVWRRTSYLEDRGPVPARRPTPARVAASLDTLYAAAPESPARAFRAPERQPTRKRRARSPRPGRLALSPVPRMR